MTMLVNRAGAEWRLPPTILFKRVPYAVHVPYLAVAGTDGAVRTGRDVVQPRQFALEGRIYYPGDKARIRRELEDLLQFLMQPPIEVHRHHRFLLAHPLGAPQDWIDEGAELGLQLPMVALDPYWYGVEATHEKAGATSCTIDVDGTAPADPLVTIEITAPGSGLHLVNTPTGQAIELDGDYLAGDVVTIDTATYDARLNDEPIIDRLSDEYITHGFELVPGTNVIEYTGPEADVTIKYRPRWY